MTITYHQVTFECSRDTAESLSLFLADSDALAVSLIDAADEPIFEPGLNEMPLWSQVKVIALFADAEQAQTTINILQQLLENMPTYKIESVEDRDWITETQAQFQPQCFADRLWVCPEWETVPHDEQAVLKLAPGLAFGTGTHPTTQMCLTALAQLVKPNMEVIDFGCGSGILGLAALALDAKKVYCIDIDPQALEATQYNADINNFAEEKLFIGMVEQMPAAVQADILVANILAQPLIDLKNIFQKLLKNDGILILAGLLETQAQQIIDAYQPWAKLHIFKQQDEWACLIADFKAP